MQVRRYLKGLQTLCFDEMIVREPLINSVFGEAGGGSNRIYR